MRCLKLGLVIHFGELYKKMASAWRCTECMESKAYQMKKFPLCVFAPLRLCVKKIAHTI